MSRDQQQGIQFWRQHARGCVTLPDGRPHPDAAIKQGARRRALQQALPAFAPNRGSES